MSPSVRWALGVALVLAPAFQGCVPTAAAPARTEHEASHSHGPAPARVGERRESGTALSVPAALPDGPAIQASVLEDGPAMMVVSIRLQGVELPPHESDLPVVISALAGEGTVVLASGNLPVDRAHAVVLDARVEHAVAPSPGTELVLLVTHVRGGAAP